ncbi:archaellin/type IV pilin N-terminal domain-containing protein [Methanococcoides alaskense]|uniref:Flagellin n=1 Tax=Methanococcoides alaskense TaxID=325778 RepID=A0AA90TZ59_9EURY|nr:archaellin/type IV pilin N-terminal domain-containing protein [Methanococcoides alaskense]MDR6222614.1 flagellin FlaB [Methanococcoides alaskense]
MKANKHLMMNNDRAQAGIGTLIIFIAMVLVAAVAAAVLIQTSGVLQEKAQATGKQATEEVSSNLMIKSIEGIRANNDTTAANMSDTVDLLKVTVALNIGSSQIDLNQAVITITDGLTTNDLVYANNDKTYGAAMTGFDATATSAANMITLVQGTDTADRYFVLEQMRDEDDSFTQATPIMNQGDLVNIYISTVSSTATAYTDLDDETATGLDSGLSLTPRSNVNIIITPESGSSTTAGFTTPTFSIAKSLALWP